MRKLSLLSLLLLFAVAIVPAGVMGQDGGAVTVMANWGGPEQVGFEAVLAALLKKLALLSNSSVTAIRK